MILKLQRPVYPPDGLVLAYDKERRLILNLNPSKKVLDALGDDVKGYFEAEVEAGKPVKIICRVPDQVW